VHAGRERRVWQAWAAVAVVGLLVAAPREARNIARAHDGLAAQRRVVADLHQLVQAPATLAVLSRCGAVTAPEYRAVPLLAYWLHRPASAIASGVARPEPGRSFVSYTSAAVAMQLSPVPRSVTVPRGAPAGLRSAYRNPSWIVYTPC